MSTEPNSQPLSVAPAAASEKISIQDFAKVQLKVAVIAEAKPHPNADKLLVLQVDTGTEKKQIVAGIARHYTPEQLIGKKIVIVDNLSPALLRGEPSNGMLLAASDGQGALTLVTPENPIAPGATVR
jgi:methionyl-tRNA synthetase